MRQARRGTLEGAIAKHQGATQAELLHSFFLRRKTLRRRRFSRQRPKRTAPPRHYFSTHFLAGQPEAPVHFGQPERLDIVDLCTYDSRIWSRLFSTSRSGPSRFPSTFSDRLRGGKLWESMYPVQFSLDSGQR